MSDKSIHNGNLKLELTWTWPGMIIEENVVIQCLDLRIYLK